MKVIAQSTVSTKMPYLHLAYTAATIRSPQGSIFTLALLMLIIGLILTFKTSARKTKNGFTAINIIFRKVTLRKRICRILLIIIGGFLLCLSFFFGTEKYQHLGAMQRIKLSILARELYSYQHSNDGEMPVISKWCDELLEASKKNTGIFRHSGTGPSRMKRTEEKISDYAINANLASLDSNEEIPPDVVVLFEAKKGWNQSGGPELINTELGSKSGCLVYFGNRDVKFIKTDDIQHLKWNIKDE